VTRGRWRSSQALRAASACEKGEGRKEGREGEGCVKGLGAAQREGWSFSHAHAGVVAEPGLA